MGKKILLADDSITIQKVIELTFSDEDFEVVTVGNGRLAIEKVQEVRPDVVLCDVIMPEKDGYEVCDFIKKSPNFSATPVLLLTGAFEPFDQERAARVGCDGFLAKPFEPDTLIAKVKDLLSRAETRQAAAAPRPAAPLPAPEPAAIPVAPPAPPPVAPPPFTAATPVTPPPPPPFAPVASTATTPSMRAPQIEDPEMAFIPDEPFEDLDTPSFGSVAGSAVAAPLPSVATVREPVEELLPMTAEESESLSGPAQDASATVMFRSDSLPWGPAQAPSAPPPVAPKSEPEVADVPIFEEMLEESEVAAPPPPPPAPARVAPFPAVLAPPPAWAPPPPAPVTAAAFRAPAPAPLAPPKAPPLAPAHKEASSFADVAAEIREPVPAAAPPSVAAQVDVPVDMVEKIAQRVVAQVSEKVVERIAWEVIPDLAEALIKREIERLKAELQQL